MHVLGLSLTQICAIFWYMPNVFYLGGLDSEDINTDDEYTVKHSLKCPTYIPIIFSNECNVWLPMAFSFLDLFLI